MTVKILTDSACDLPFPFYEENHVTFFPLKVLLNEREYEDQLTIKPKTIYEAIRKGQQPKTSQISPLTVEKTFTELAQKNEQGIYIAFSSQLSGTYQTAVMVLEQVKETYPDFQFTIIDSKCASLGRGLVVMEAVRLANKNTDYEELINKIEFYASRMEHLFTVEDLDYLAKGGRVSKASAFVGGLLNIKPLLNVEDGKLVPLEKIRGKKKLLRRMIEVMRERGVDLEQQTIGISHADDAETAAEMKKLIEEAFGTKSVLISEIGAVIGSHTGAGTIAVFFLNSHPS